MTTEAQALVKQAEEEMKSLHDFFIESHDNLTVILEATPVSTNRLDDIEREHWEALNSFVENGIKEFEALEVKLAELDAE